MMLSWVEVDAQRIGSNLEAFRKLAGGARLMAVVKANAYGHGVEIAGLTADTHADWLGVNSLTEAEDLRLLGATKPILILGHTPAGRLDRVVEYGFRQVVFTADAARALSEAAVALGKIAYIHLKIETGTHRLGFDSTALAGAVRALIDLPRVHIEGAYTHFANIEDTLDPSFARLQIERFHDALSILDDAGIRPDIVHAAASAGAILYPETRFQMIRIGIGAYGIWPSRETRLAARELGRERVLEPALAWKSSIAQIQDVPRGESVGYGRTYRATHGIRVAIVPIGYVDGYDRKLSNNAMALVHGQCVPVIGRVAMNMLALDVSDSGAVAHDEVVLLGRQGSAEITVEDLAERCGTIPYEVLSRINPGLSRIRV